MLTLPAEFESHLQGAVTTHCFAWILRRADQVTIGFCDHDMTLLVQGINCYPQSGMNGSEATNQLGLGTGSSEVEGILKHDILNEADIERGLYDGAQVETYLVNWMQPEQAVLLRRSAIGKITRSGARFTAELKGSAAMLDQVFGRRVKRYCDAEFADRRCRVNGSDPRYGGEGRVEAASGHDLIVSGLGAFSSGWFEGGRLEWLGGANQASLNSIISHVGVDEAASLVLRDMPVFTVQAGDRFHILCGCDKSFQQCRDRFANQENFRGFPHIPGNDAAYAYVGGQDEFDGGALVP